MERLLDILLTGTDVMHACGGKGRCTTCKVEIISGVSFLSARTPAEERYASIGKLTDRQRLSCQVQIFGEVDVQIPLENQLPHLSYS